MGDAGQLTRERLQLAAADFDVAQRCLMPPPHFELAAYHVQQSAEKLLKALLTHRARIFEKTHDLSRLCQWCGEIEPLFLQFMDEADRLTTFAVDVRYPGVEPPSQHDVERACAAVKQLQGLVYGCLPPEVRMTF